MFKYGHKKTWLKTSVISMISSIKCLMEALKQKFAVCAVQSGGISGTWDPKGIGRVWPYQKCIALWRNDVPSLRLAPRVKVTSQITQPLVCGFPNLRNPLLKLVVAFKLAEFAGPSHQRAMGAQVGTLAHWSKLGNQKVEAGLKPAAS